MKLGLRNIEWILISIMVVSTLAVYLFISAAMLDAPAQTTATNLFLIMIFGGQILMCIILLRIYDKISSSQGLVEEKQ